MNGKITLFLTALSLMLTACIAPPKGLEAERFSVTHYREISTQDFACQCQNARLGGKVLEATILPQQTKLEILSLPVGRYTGKPDVEAQSDGRFIAYINGFVDPENLKDRYITVGGKITGSEQGKIDQADYTYPVIQAENYRLWTLAKSYYYPDDEWDDWGYWGFRHRAWSRWYNEPEIRYYLR